MTKEQQCKVALEGWGEYQARRKEYQEHCPKSKSNNIVFCPKKIIRREKDKKVQWINEYFKNFIKKSKTKNNKKGRGKKKKSKSNTIKKVKEIKKKVINIKNIKLYDINIKLDDININIIPVTQSTSTYHTLSGKEKTKNISKKDHINSKSQVLEPNLIIKSLQME